MRGVDDMSGRTRRRISRMAETVRREREAGTRPPPRDALADGPGLDPLLDRIIRHIETRRARNALQRAVPR